MFYFSLGLAVLTAANNSNVYICFSEVLSPQLCVQYNLYSSEIAANELSGFP